MSIVTTASARASEKVVGVADLKVSNVQGEKLITYALGSCLGIVLHDPVANVAGMLHVMLPTGTIDPAKMATLKTVFRENGVITAANSSQISDGASAVLVGDRDAAKADGLKPRARFLARVVVGSDPTLQLDGVIPATRLALERAKLSVKDVDWFEVNEAFACVPLAWAREFAPAPEKLNPWGGAIAHGHPLGATGGGLMAKMLAGLEAMGGTIGLQTMCIGHGMATATIIERI